MVWEGGPPLVLEIEIIALKKGRFLNNAIVKEENRERSIFANACTLR